MSKKSKKRKIKKDHTQKELKETKEKMLRLAADFDNFRKKTEEERPEIEEKAQVELLMQLLPVFDNFDRAYQHIPVGDKEKDWVRGVIAIEKLFHKILSDLDIKKYHVKDKEFDPETMDAIISVEDKDVPESFVIEELEPGYKKNGRIIRHAKVKVSRGSSKQDTGNRDDNENDDQKTN